MWLYIIMILVTTGLLGWPLAVVWWRARAVSTLVGGDQSLYREIIAPSVDYLAYRLVTLLRDLARTAYFYLLLSFHKLIRWLKYAIIRIEYRFARFVDPIKGRPHEPELADK